MIQEDTFLKFALISKYANNNFVDIYSCGDLEKSIYPASLSKVFIAAEVLRQIEITKLNFTRKIKIHKNNVANFSRKEFPFSKFPILKENKKYSIEKLIFLMLQRSDDTATNALIDLVTRESINHNIISKLEYIGSDLTRKFCPRNKEELKYKDNPITMTKPIHFVDFYKKLINNDVISNFVSDNLKKMMQKCIGKTNLNFINDNANCYYKGGYFMSKLSNGQKCIHRHYTFAVEKNDDKYIFIYFSITKTNIFTNTIIENDIKRLYNQFIL